MGDGEDIREIEGNHLNHNYMEQIISKIFDTLDDWRQLPAYQLERRADIFFGIYLEEILNENSEVEFLMLFQNFPFDGED